MINGLVEIVAVTIIMFAMAYIPRGKLTFLTVFGGGLIIIVCGILLGMANGRESMKAASQWLSFCGKFAISGAFG